MTRFAAATALCVTVTAALAKAQSPIPQVEVAMTAGASTEDVQALATQVRIFGEPKKNVRFFLEGAWARQFGEESDAFGAAYPYDNEAHPIETYVETMAPTRKALLGV